MFPKYKTIKKKFIFWNYEKKIEDGWENLGRILPTLILSKSGYREKVEYPICPHCNHCLYSGKEGDKIFRYCPHCLIKVEEYKIQQDEYGYKYRLI